MARASRAARAKRQQGAPRADAAVRRSRLLFLGALVVTAVVLFAWFPAASLLHQRSNLASTQDQLATLHAQDAALGQEQKSLSDNSEIGRIAREQYQLVGPGQQAYEVLPPSGSAAAGAPYAGDPGSAGPVAPSAASELPPGEVTTTTLPPATKGAHAAGASRSGSGFVARVLHSLEFWN